MSYPPITPGGRWTRHGYHVRGPNAHLRRDLDGLARYLGCTRAEAAGGVVAGLIPIAANHPRYGWIFDFDAVRSRIVGNACRSPKDFKLY